VTEDELIASRPEHPGAMPLSELAQWLVELQAPDAADASDAPDLSGGDPLVTGVTLSTQRIRPGDLYAALRGSRAHGATYSSAAAAAGAVGVLTDAEGADQARQSGLPVLVVESPRAVLGALAAKVYGDPAADLRLIGVTGTQGKTTTTRLLEGGLEGAGIRAGVIGTVGTRMAGRDVKTALTTPEAPDLHGLFARMREEGVAACAMEVSSHALVMGRVDGVVFDVAVFLNLGRDHLDFHADLEDYYQAKASLFTLARARAGLVNLDDEHGRRLASDAAIPVRTFGIHDDTADWRATDLDLAADGSTFTVVGPGVEFAAHCPLAGEFNVSNTLAAIAAAGEAGFDPAAVAAAIGVGGGVPGRLEKIEAGQDFVVVVDYAHKPDAVEATLATLRPLTNGRLVIVIGAGGDRDPGKRPMMGEIAARLADVLIVTDDNPRTEDPSAIRAAVLAGARGPAEVHEIGDRRAAIREAMLMAKAGDIVVVAGKGHEAGQEVAGVVHPFDDRDVVRDVAREELTR